MRKISVIGMPMKYGCYVDGADLAYDYLKDILSDIFGVKNSNVVDNSYENPMEHKKDKKIRYLEPVMELSNRLYSKTYESLEKGNIPFVIGGDHSTCIGSISAALDYYKGDVSVIYIDKHADIHTEKTTPSGNIHGMPLSICIGRCDERFNIGTYKLKPENLYYIGLNSYEIEEISYILDNNIFHYMGFEVEDMRAEAIVKSILKRINTKHVHLSIDLDCLSNEEFNAVNVAVEGTYNDERGLTIRKLRSILTLLLKEVDVCSMDLVEYNPLLDTDLKCKDKIKDILLDINDSLRR